MKAYFVRWSGIRRGWCCGLALGIMVTGTAPAAEPVLGVVRATQVGRELLQNGAFAEHRDGAPAHWRGAPRGFALELEGGREGSAALRCASPAGDGWFGASQTLGLDRPVGPLMVGGWSRAENVSGSTDRGYSIYVDIVYTDGTPLWGQTGDFRCGSHDWEQQEFMILPQKPVRTITLHCLFRGHTGTVWFDDVSVRELVTDGDTLLVQGVPVLVQPGGAHRLRAAGELASRPDAPAVPDWSARFLARDVAAGSDFFGFENGACPELGLRVKVTASAAELPVTLTGEVRDTTGRDRAITLMFTWPVGAENWRWGDNLHHDRLIRGTGDFTHQATVRSGATGMMSIYPMAAIWSDAEGVALGLDMAKPAQYRLGYHAGLRSLYGAFDLGLVPETVRLPGGAEFSLALFPFEAAWGFRGAWQRYMELFPEFFRVRARDQGIWMPFTDVSTVEGWEDFGFKFHEGNNNVPWDDAHGVLSFRYTEPMTWWMKMDPAVPRTPEAALRVRAELAQGSNAHLRGMARVAEVAGMADAGGEPCVQFLDTPWCDGAVWSLNPNPWLDVPAAAGAGDRQAAEGQTPTNAATVHWNPAIREQLYGASARGRLDGEYLDSLEGYVTADLNFRREHFRYSTVPLTFDTATQRPALSKGLAVFEFTRWMAADVHRLGKLMFANSVPYRFTFLCPWLDVMGTETDWQRGDEYVPAALAQMDLWRTLSGAKPYLLLLNTDYDRFTPDRVERYFQRALFYGMFPSMFSHNASENPYWKAPKYYNRDRHLFKKYIPIIKRVAEAGWQPVTRARSDNPHLLVERFGPDAAGGTYFTLYNDTGTPQRGTVRLTADPGEPPRSARGRELLGDRAVDPAEGSAAGGWRIELQSQQAAVLEVVP